jgi:hypothetical protein
MWSNMINGNSEKKNATQNTNHGWDKTLPAIVRRDMILQAYHGNELAAAQVLQTLANITRDKETRQLAATDAVYLLKMHQMYSKPHIISQPYCDGQLPEKEDFGNKNPAE